MTIRQKNDELNFCNNKKENEPDSLQIVRDKKILAELANPSKLRKMNKNLLICSVWEYLAPNTYLCFCKNRDTQKISFEKRLCLDLLSSLLQLQLPNLRNAFFEAKKLFNRQQRKIKILSF